MKPLSSIWFSSFVDVPRPVVRRALGEVPRARAAAGLVDELHTAAEAVAVDLERLVRPSISSTFLAPIPSRRYITISSGSMTEITGA